ncbi:hypothetical protein CR513_45465, partial [Mucuna pruriens]
MKVLLGTQDALKVVEKCYTFLEYEGILVKTKKNDQQTLTYIYQGLDEVMFDMMSNVSTSKETLEILKTFFEGKEGATTNSMMSV